MTTSRNTGFAIFHIRFFICHLPDVPIRTTTSAEQTELRVITYLTHPPFEAQSSLRSRRKHKAWGGAQRNPRITNQLRTPSPRSGRQTLHCKAHNRDPLSPAPQALIPVYAWPLGLTPQALCSRLLRRLRRESGFGRSGLRFGTLQVDALTLFCDEVSAPQARWYRILVRL